MPYKDPQRKWEWEQRHRTQRVARRRELRRIEAARQAAEPPPEPEDHSAAFLLPVLVGGSLAANNPKLAMGAGGLTLLVAAIYKKDWRWWVVGILTLAFGAFFQWNKNNEKK